MVVPQNEREVLLTVSLSTRPVSLRVINASAVNAIVLNLRIVTSKYH